MKNPSRINIQLSIFLSLLALPLDAMGKEISTGTWWNSQTQPLEVKEKEVLFRGESFPIGKETIVDSWTVFNKGWLSRDSAECRISTRLAHRAPSGEIVLLTMTRSRPSNSRGLACRFVKDTGSFANPFHYEQVVVTPDNSDGLNVSSVEVRDDLRRPDLKVEQLKDPNVTKTNKALSDFIKENLKPSTPWPRVTTFKSEFKKKAFQEPSGEEDDSSEEHDSAPGT
ncbi:MAG TPA: hypothetical protein VIH99_05755 [Bdellovibrionota bacterium]|jgi:hypothetical protein